MIALLVSVIVSLGIWKEWLSDHKRSKSDKLTNEFPHRRIVKVALSNKNEDALSQARRTNSLKTEGKYKNNETQQFSYFSEEIKC